MIEAKGLVDQYFELSTHGFSDGEDGPFSGLADILAAGRAMPLWLREHRHPCRQDHMADVVIHFSLDIGLRLTRDEGTEAERLELIAVAGDAFASLVDIGRSAGISTVMFWDSILATRWTRHASAAVLQELERVLTELVPRCRPTSARIGMIDSLARLDSTWAEALVEDLRTLHPRKREVDHAAQFAIERIRAGGGSNFLAVPGEKQLLPRQSRG